MNNRLKIQQAIDKQEILKYIWNCAKNNPKWSLEIAKVLASMHQLDYKLVYKMGKMAKNKKIFNAKDWGVDIEGVSQ